MFKNILFSDGFYRLIVMLEMYPNIVVMSTIK